MPDMEETTPEEYKVKLEVFEGPLDLLLFLIKKEEVSITDIPIERICDQYNEHLKFGSEIVDEKKTCNAVIAFFAILNFAV